MTDSAMACIMGVLLLEIDHPVGRLRACLVVLILNQNYFEFLTEIFKRCDKTNTVVGELVEYIFPR